MTRSLAAPLLSVLLISSAALAAEDTPDATRAARVVRAQGSALGADVELTVAVPTDVDGRMATAHLEDALKEMRRVGQLLDPSRADGALAQLAASAGASPVPLEAEVFTLLDEAMRVARLTRGAVDPTAAVLADIWRFEAGSTPPSEEQLKPRVGLVSYKDLALDPATRTAKLERAGMRVDLTSVTRGYALNRAAALLESRGVRDFVLSIGGDLVVRGKKGGAAWTIGLQDPRAPGHWAALQAAGAVMTTSDHERSYTHEGKRVHDVVDPRTGRPGALVRSATVVAGDAITADLLSRALFLLGPKAGLRLVQRTKGAEGVVVTADNKVKMTTGLSKSLRYRPPSD
jgi:thiamine biosynthesis lipoprotein